MLEETITLAISMLIPCGLGALAGQLAEYEKRPMLGGGIGMAIGFIFGNLLLL